MKLRMIKTILVGLTFTILNNSFAMDQWSQRNVIFWPFPPAAFLLPPVSLFQPPTAHLSNTASLFPAVQGFSNRIFPQITEQTPIEKVADMTSLLASIPSLVSSVDPGILQQIIQGQIPTPTPQKAEKETEMEDPPVFENFQNPFALDHYHSLIAKAGKLPKWLVNNQRAANQCQVPDVLIYDPYFVSTIGQPPRLKHAPFFRKLAQKAYKAKAEAAKAHEKSQREDGTVNKKKRKLDD